MRISDADRDRAASVLSEALAQGRLSPQEHSDRLDAVFAAKTQADITPLVRDLPGTTAALASARPGSVVGPDHSGRLVSVLSGIRRTGAWPVPAKMNALSVLGGIDLDLREAELPGREIQMRATCIVGGVDITVPPGMRVTAESARADAPVLRITGFSILGGISVRRKRRENDDTAGTPGRLNS
jgi:hypothetical protein